MKKILLTLLVLVGMLAFSGCAYEGSMVINEDGSVKMTTRALMTLDEYKQMLTLSIQLNSADAEPVEVIQVIDDAEIPEDPQIPVAQEPTEEQQLMLAAFEKVSTLEELKAFAKIYLPEEEETFANIEEVTIGGITYLTDPTQVQEQELTVEEVAERSKQSGLTIDANTFVIDATTVESFSGNQSGMGSIEDPEAVAEYMDTLASTKMIIHVTMPKEILFTNGELSEDKKTATFTIGLVGTLSKYYAFTEGSESIIDLGVNDGEYIRKGKVSVFTPDKITSIEVNGESVTAKKLDISKDGEYTVVVKTENSEKKVTFIKDSKKPVIKGVKNGKTYTKAVTVTFSDAASGIKWAKLNGKKIKTGKKITKAGEYTLVVKDKAGNKQTVKFTIGSSKKKVAGFRGGKL